MLSRILKEIFGTSSLAVWSFYFLVVRTLTPEKVTKKSAIVIINLLTQRRYVYSHVAISIILLKVLYFHVIKRMRLYPHRKKTALNGEVRLTVRYA